MRIHFFSRKLRLAGCRCRYRLQVQVSVGLPKIRSMLRKEEGTLDNAQVNCVVQVQVLVVSIGVSTITNDKGAL